MHLAIYRPAVAAPPTAILPAKQSASLAPTRQVLHRVFVTIIVLLARLQGQSASTGALTGVALDPSRRALVGVVLHLTNEAAVDAKGRFLGAKRSHSAGGTFHARATLNFSRPIVTALCNQE